MLPSLFSDIYVGNKSCKIIVRITFTDIRETHLSLYWDSSSIQGCFPWPLLNKPERYRLNGLGVWSVGNWLTAHTQKVLINGFCSGWQSVTSEDLRDWYWAPFCPTCSGIAQVMGLRASPPSFLMLLGRWTWQKDKPSHRDIWQDGRWASKSNIEFIKDKC